MINVSLDYLDRRVFRKRETEILLPDKSRRLVSDKFAVELFEKVGFEYEHKNSYKSVFHSKNKAIYFLDEDDFEGGLQEKGALFNLADWQEKHDLLTKHITENKCSSHYTRADLAFTTTENWFSLIEKIDFKNLLVKTYTKDNVLESITAENSRMTIIFYDKTKALKKVRNEDYLTAFKEKFPQEQIYRFEVRLKGKDTLAKVPSLEAEKIHLKTVATEIFQAMDKRVRLPQGLKNKLLGAIYEIK